MKNKRIPRPKPTLCLIPCKCERRVLTSLIPGQNNITTVCECGAVLRVDITYDGYGIATIKHGTIEAVTNENI